MTLVNDTPQVALATPEVIYDKLTIRRLRINLLHGDLDLDIQLAACRILDGKIDTPQQPDLYETSVKGLYATATFTPAQQSALQTILDQTNNKELLGVLLTVLLEATKRIGE